MASIGAQEFYRQKRDALIKDFEKFRSEAYLDGMGIPTIGYGATSYSDGRPVQMGETITPQAADELYDHHVQTTTEQLNQSEDFRKLDPATKAGLTSFAFNVGPNFIGHKNFGTITGAIESGDSAAIQDSMNLYVNPGTSTEAGLRRRRAAEIGLMKSQYTGPTMPSNPPGQFTERGGSNPHSGIWTP